MLRYVDSARAIREVFVGFYECSHGVPGEAFPAVILCSVSALGLGMAFCIAQCYDGAGIMAGSGKGATARIH